jgi:hypothetical protein
MADVTKLQIRNHSKASEKYVDVVFNYHGNVNVATSIPLEYRRTGTDIQTDEVDTYLLKVRNEINPEKWAAWRLLQDTFWKDKPGASTTKSFFDKLNKNFDWCCATCCLPTNRNFARRIQDLKEFGYTIATNTKLHCVTCGKNTMQLILIPLARGGITGYETWSNELRNKIIEKLKSYDAFEARHGRKEGLLPDHKFPEIRWDSATKRPTIEDLNEEEIVRDFQLLSNQRNQQKREVCRGCFQTGNRGVIYGIAFFHKGNNTWDVSVPKKGKEAERGCAGCAWYDIAAWRVALQSKLKVN